MQLTELQFYINNLERCLGIVNLLSTRIQDHQCYTIIKCVALFTSQFVEVIGTSQSKYKEISFVYQRWC